VLEDRHVNMSQSPIFHCIIMIRIVESNIISVIPTDSERKLSVLHRCRQTLNKTMRSHHWYKICRWNRPYMVDVKLFKNGRSVTHCVAARPRRFSRPSAVHVVDDSVVDVRIANVVHAYLASDDMLQVLDLVVLLVNGTVCMSKGHVVAIISYKLWAVLNTTAYGFTLCRRRKPHKLCRFRAKLSVWTRAYVTVSWWHARVLDSSPVIFGVWERLDGSIHLRDQHVLLIVVRLLLNDWLCAPTSNSTHCLPIVKQV